VSDWGTEEERERHRRIKVAAWAYAYEVEDDSIVDDATFDREALLIRPEVSTGDAVLDAFFRAEFGAYTGAWVLAHPEKHKLPRICSLMRRRNSAVPARVAEMGRAIERWEGEQGVLL